MLLVIDPKNSIFLSQKERAIRGEASHLIIKCCQREGNCFRTLCHHPYLR